jgi:hypothetical protein
VSRLRTLWCVAIALAVLSSAAIAYQRWIDDSRYVSVEICVEFESAVAHSDLLGYASIGSYLSALRESGAVSIAIHELSFDELISGRSMTVFTGLELQSRDVLTPISLPPIRALIDSGEIRTESLYVLPGDAELAAVLSRCFAVASLEPVSVELLTTENRSVIEITGDPLDISGCRFGLPAEDVRLVLDAGLQVVPRLANPRSGSVGAIDLSLQPLAAIRDLGPVVFSGTEVLGYPDNLAYAAARMRELNAVPALIEFHAQQGARVFADSLDHEIVRVHSITSEEYLRLSGAEMLDRLLRAVSERNIRLLYLRPHVIEARLTDGTALDFISSLRYRLEDAGFSVGPARAYPSRQPVLLRLLMPIIAAGAVALGMLIIDYVYPMQLPAQIVMTMIAAMSAAIIALSDMLLARLLLALAIAVAVPAVAVLASVIRTGNLSEGSEVRPIVSAFHAWLTAVSIAVAGGLVVAGILSDRAFFVKSAQFLGVKASHTLPFALGGGLLWWYRYGEEYASGRIQVSRSVKRALLTPLRFWHVLAAAGTIGVFVVYLARTGNTFVIDVPVVDRRLREAFEAFLPVRPRTKEVFIGHPALVASLYAWVRSRGRCQFALYGALVGMVGLISVVNSFAHLHTPISLTLLRVLLGAAVSLPVSLLLVFAVGAVMSMNSGQTGLNGIKVDAGARDPEVRG